MTDIPNIKQKLRQAMKQRRSQIPELSRHEQAREASLLAEQEVLQPLRSKLNRSLTVFIYASFQDEPDTSHLMNQCWMKGDRVLVPKVVGEGRLTLHELKEASDLHPGAWGIPEPAEHTEIWPESRLPEIDLIIVPGLAYDKTGGRIGFGGGFYDRFISALHLSEGRDTEMITAALAFREQILTDCIPMESHDFKLDLLFTASGTIYINEGSERLCLQNPKKGN
ncbi:5-formyltetrahydrofolate cyclo-ligase [Paenibacillus bouchesdurhonensis]|uniref:5-formyltetrahydrofolate cyclo-ligase n=1 Tax=Paenibacillus bouchesdurhonensis TaxID=1870990 RepID=UPI000DA639A2|nr:5-formyltetrahydrofolate cyclo-ligase [Paenibacillus bouchesdurhonensis]